MQVDTATLGNNSISLYINGKLDQGSLTQSGLPATSTQSVKIGARGTDASPSTFFPGKIDDVKIYNYARTAGQVAYDYNRGAPVAHWKLDECQGAIAYDATSQRNNGTITIGASGEDTVGTCTTSSTAWGSGASGKYGASLSFDKTDDYVDLDSAASDMPSGTTNVTLSAWIKPTTFATNRSIVVYGGTASNKGYGIGVGNTASKANMSINGTYYSGSSTLSASQWYHIVGVYDHTNVKLYVNGVLDLTQSVTSSVTSDTTLRIGMEPSRSMYFDGQIDDVKIFNYPLSAAQVRKLFNEGGAVRYGP